MASEVTIYTTRFCPFCVRAKQLLKSKNVDFNEIPVDSDGKLRKEMMKKSGRRTVPQIWIGQRHIGGCDDLFELEHDGKLTELLA